jgi:hypothetical protein
MVRERKMAMSSRISPCFTPRQMGANQINEMRYRLGMKSALNFKNY